jgi:ethanolamine ammonia-lyase small subunit
MTDQPMARKSWMTLRELTQARIALGRVGASLPTQATLEFGLAHARARDAVHAEFRADWLSEQLQAAQLPSLLVHSAAENRERYLRRPDLGRRLNAMSRERIASYLLHDRPDVVFVIADGLSTQAPMIHALPVLLATSKLLPNWRLGPVVVAEQSRVALGDEIGELLDATQVVMMIGERPGLSSPDSLGLYLTYGPRIGRVDAERNCISNVHQAGLGYEAAAHKLAYLLINAKARQLSGVQLKDESAEDIGRALHALGVDASTPLSASR